MVGGVWVGLFLGGGAIYPLLRLLPVGQLAKSFTRKVQRSMLLVYVPVSSTSRVGANVPFPIPKLIIVCAIQFRRFGISVWLNSKGRLVERYIAKARTKTPQSTPMPSSSPCCGVC